MASLSRVQAPRAAPSVAAARTRQRVVSVSARKTASRSTSKTATATFICLDCGWIYDGSQGPFEKLPASYRCPVCNSPKRRFVKEEGRKGPKGAAMQRGSKDGEFDEGDKSFFLVAAAGAAAFLGGLYFFLNSQVS